MPGQPAIGSLSALSVLGLSHLRVCIAARQSRAFVTFVGAAQRVASAVSYGSLSVVSMANDGELWGTLSGLNATFLNRWSSAWADLQAADMALLERGQLDDSKMANVFHRRALWESAVASYGRCAVSNKKRKIAFKDFVAEIVGDDGLAVHERIMDWRHGHVAHRNGAEFESVETGFTYADGPGHPTSLNVALVIDAGPPNSSEFVAAFEEHVKTLRDALWEQKLFPLAGSVVDDVNAGRIARPTEPRIPEDRTGEGRYTLNLSISTLGKGGSIR